MTGRFFGRNESCKLVYQSDDEKDIMVYRSECLLTSDSRQNVKVKSEYKSI